MVLFITRLTAASTMAKWFFCTDNLTHELIVSKFSYLRHEETVTHYIKINDNTQSGPKSCTSFGDIRFILSWTVPKIWLCWKMYNLLGAVLSYVVLDGFKFWRHFNIGTQRIWSIYTLRLQRLATWFPSNPLWERFDATVTKGSTRTKP